MAVFHTAGAPPRSGRAIRANMGWMRNRSPAPTKIVAPNRISTLAPGAGFWTLTVEPGCERVHTGEAPRARATVGRESKRWAS